MNPKELAPNLSVSPQLSIADIGEAKARGFLSVVVNRPDAEEPGQPTIAEMREAARVGRAWLRRDSRFAWKSHG